MNIISQNFNILKSDNSQLKKSSDVVSVPQAATHTTIHATTTTASGSLNKYLVNFTGLNRTLSKMAYSSARAIEAETANFPKSNGVVGNLPAEWVQKIPKEKREAAIKEFYQDFKTIIKDFRQDSNTETTSQRLKEALSKAGIIKDGQDLKAKKLGEGQYGVAYQLQGLSGDNYVLKVFRSNSIYSFHHGNFVEANRAAYWQKHAGKNTQMVPFYFADVDAGYMVNKFVDESTSKFKKYVNPEIYGLRSNDIDPVLKKENLINGFQIDYGGISIEQASVVKNKAKQFALKKFLAQPKEKQLSSLHAADDVVKELFIKKFDSIPVCERTAYFTQMAKNSDDEIASALAGKIFLLPEKDRLECFNMMTKNANDTVRASLAMSITYLPEGKKAECFKQLSNDAGEKVKAVLSYKISLLPVEERVEYFNKLAENGKDEVKMGLSNNIYSLPESEKTVGFKKLMKNAGEKAKVALVANVSALPEKDQPECLKQLAKGAGEAVKIELAKKVGCVPENERYEFFVQVAENAGEKAKDGLSKVIFCLPESKREACIKLIQS